MKHFLFIFLIAVATVGGALTLTGCKGEKPQFKYALEVTGDVEDSATAITSDFTATVTNVPVDTFVSTYIAPLEAEGVNGLPSLNCDQGAAADDFLTEAVNTYFISQFNASTTAYYIHIVGYINEATTGLTFQVDKVFSNKQ